MPEVKCGQCSFRAKYDNNSKSLLGRLWRWHINWCPGWKLYLKTLSDNDRNLLQKKYNLNLN